MAKIKVETIRITIGRKTLELTPEELKELRDILDETFPKYIVPPTPAPIIIERPVYKKWPYPRWTEPVYKDNTMTFTCQRTDEA